MRRGGLKAGMVTMKRMEVGGMGKAMVALIGGMMKLWDGRRN